MLFIKVKYYKDFKKTAIDVFTQKDGYSITVFVCFIMALDLFQIRIKVDYLGALCFWCVFRFVFLKGIFIDGKYYSLHWIAFAVISIIYYYREPIP
jgi:hypothetical protein